MRDEAQSRENMPGVNGAGNRCLSSSYAHHLPRGMQGLSLSLCLFRGVPRQAQVNWWTQVGFEPTVA